MLRRPASSWWATVPRAACRHREGDHPPVSRDASWSVASTGCRLPAPYDSGRRELVRRVARPAPDCLRSLRAQLTPAPTGSGLLPGMTHEFNVPTGTKGTVVFKCLIHPWMQTTVTVH